MFIAILLGFLLGTLLWLLVCNLPKIDSANVSAWYFEDSPLAVQKILPPIKPAGLFRLPSDCSSCGNIFSFTALIPFFCLFKVIGKCRGPCYYLYVKLALIQFLTVGVVLLFMFGGVFGSEEFLLLLLSCSLIVAMFIDLDYKYVPVNVLSLVLITSVGLMVVGHAFHAVEHFYILIFILLGLSLVNFRKTRLGSADISIIACFGLFLELSNLLELVYLAFIFAGFQFFAYWLKAKKVQNVPFVPALFFSFIMVCYLDIKPSAYLLLHF